MGISSLGFPSLLSISSFVIRISFVIGYFVTSLCFVIMFRHWYYSLLMLVTYVSVFLFWKQFPSRVNFVVGLRPRRDQGRRAPGGMTLAAILRQ